GLLLFDGLNVGNSVPNHQVETAVVAGKLMGLGRTRIADAVGVSCMQPQTTANASWPAPAKGLLTGWPVHTGVTAAELAAAGVVGKHDILENTFGYFYRLSDIERPEEMAVVTGGAEVNGQVMPELPRGPGDKWAVETLISKEF